MAPVPAAVPGYSFEFGARYWYSSGKLAKDLYDDPRFTNDIVSRLTYDGLTVAFVRGVRQDRAAEQPVHQGLCGHLGPSKGSLNDEDFPPLTVPYSSTMSSQSGGRLGYMTADLGYGFAVNPAPSCRCSPATAMSARR